METAFHCTKATPTIEVSWVNGKKDSVPCVGVPVQTILDDLKLRAVYLKNSGVRNPDAAEEEDYKR